MRVGAVQRTGLAPFCEREIRAILRKIEDEVEEASDNLMGAEILDAAFDDGLGGVGDHLDALAGILRRGSSIKAMLDDDAEW